MPFLSCMQGPVQGPPAPPRCPPCPPAGALCEALSLSFNTGRFSNSITLWLSMAPSEIFFYVFLPPLLLDSAVRVDFFMFKKVRSRSGGSGRGSGSGSSTSCPCCPWKAPCWSAFLCFKCCLEVAGAVAGQWNGQYAVWRSSTERAGNT